MLKLTVNKDKNDWKEGKNDTIPMIFLSIQMKKINGKSIERRNIQ